MAIALAVLVGIVVVLARELAAPAPTLLTGLVVLVITGTVPPDAAFAGFSSPATLTIAGLFVVARALTIHGGLAPAVTRLLGTQGSDRAVLARLVAPVLVMSAVIANTPVVATLGPMVRSWAERNGRAASTFLMPLSFAAVLGGIITTIGTSTNLVVSGLTRQAGVGAFRFFEILPLGLPVAAVGAVVIVLLAPRVLPDRRSSYAQVSSDERDYTFRLQVDEGGELDGARVGDSGLRNLDQVYLAGLRRGDLEIELVTPGTMLQAGDVLTFVGRVDQVRELSTQSGLVHADETQMALLPGSGHGLVEAVVGTNSPLVGRTPKQVAFRGHYGAAIVAIHRAGTRVDAKLGEVQLHAGDALLLMTDSDFEDRWRPAHDFGVVVSLDDVDGGRSPRRTLVLATTAGMVLAAALGVPILTAVLAACLVVVASRSVRFFDARDSLDLDVLLIVASAIGLGGALEVTGLAGEAATLIEQVAVGTNPRIALVVVLLGTLVMTELITNVAAAAIMVPIALDVAARVDADPMGWAVAVAVMGSASFLTPIGYQTNTIVYGLGGYRFGDYWRLGLPLTVLVITTSVILVPVVWS